MKADEIRQTFLDYFRERGHAVRPSASLVPAEDPTLLFTNAGMVPFKKAFLGMEKVAFSRATTSQKCVRAGGKHNDLEEVGKTARHHTFFEMLGNFSFGDYFKRDAIPFAWELLTDVFGMDPQRLYVTVHHTDEEAAALWQELVGVPADRIFRLGDEDNFWQMADTGPCGPCSELHYDLRPDSERGDGRLDTATFVVLSDAGRLVELWNLVFMQFDRDAAGTLHPLPAPSIDTGAGLERLAAVLQGVDSNFHTDMFRPLLDRVAEVVGRPYDPTDDASVSYRVLADHARAVAFLLADGVYPSNEGRGYVLRRILRRAVRHAWLLGRREPTVVHVVDAVVTAMGRAYPQLPERREHLVATTRAEEERFLATIAGGLDLFDALAPSGGAGGVIAGEEAFRLYDTHGFPLDLTELMAEERGYTVDREGFEGALEVQRQRSRADRARSSRAVEEDASLSAWSRLGEPSEQRFRGYEGCETETEVLAFQGEDGRIGLVLRDNPFYVESGGQVSDRGVVEGSGWRVAVDDVRRIEGVTAVFGALEGDGPSGGDQPVPVRASVERPLRRDTERNHTATHLLHAALRGVLGPHVVQRGSLVAPDRLRFDFAHTAPLTAGEKAEVERRVNEAIWEDHPVTTREMAYGDAVGQGAMALFGEKYGDEVRVVGIPDVSMELCGGTHVRHTGEIGLFKLVAESGVAAGVRRIEAVTGPGAFRRFEEVERTLERTADVLRTSTDNVVHRAEQILEERTALEELLDELRRGGGGGEDTVHEARLDLPGGRHALYRAVRMKVRDADDARAWGDGFTSSVESGVAVVAAETADGRHSLFTFVTDDLIQRGVRADYLVREVASRVGGKGGGRPHMAQAGVGDPAGLDEALVVGEAVVRRLAGVSAA